MPLIRLPVHPGEILQVEFLAARGISQTTLARTLGVKPGRVNELVRAKRGITPETAWMLAAALGTTPEFWMNLQMAYDLARARPKKTRIKKLPAGIAADD
jgi:antitoxin HigA-1